jgi:hypothetical protein
LYFRLPFRIVPIHALESGWVGRSVISCTSQSPSMKHAICCLGGPVAETRYSGVSLDQLLASSITAVDVEMAEAALKRAVGSAPFDVALSAALRVVEFEWHRIDRLAVQLRRRAALDNAECRRIAARR